ncbi:hypothetical protein PF010_g29659 [Phytophthora fragariae]|uniref:Uncharacterized protein n=1 Tax=Phytophthora fragariae TaxID=53985 RepID=A0A6G0JN85_9STRA|nr:hypothetical protein PF010_g29659 [Phytophthora fragariae]
MSLDLKLYSGLALHDRSLTGQEAVLPLPDSVLLPLTDSVVVLPKSMKHLAATRPLASKVPAYSVLLLLKQHPESTATQLSASAVPTNPTAVHADSGVELRKQHLAATRPWALEVPADSVLLLLKQHSDMREDLAATRRSKTTVLPKQHLSATRPLTSKVPVDSVLLLLKQHPESTATQLSASAVLTNPASEVPTNSELLLLKQHLDMAATRLSASVVLRKQHLAATRPWALEVPADSVLLLLKQHSDMVATRLSASVVPINPILALL